MIYPLNKDPRDWKSDDQKIPNIILCVFSWYFFRINMGSIPRGFWVPTQHLLWSAEDTDLIPEASREGGRIYQVGPGSSSNEL